MSQSKLSSGGCFVSWAFSLQITAVIKNKEKYPGHVVPVGVPTYIMQIVLLASWNWALGFTSHCNAFRVFQGLVCHCCWQLVFVYIWSCFWVHFTVDFWWKNVQCTNVQPDTFFNIYCELNQLNFQSIRFIFS